MKSIKTFIFLIFLAFILNGCDELIKKDVEVPITFVVSEFVNITEELHPEHSLYNKFLSSGEYDLLSHPDVANVFGTPDKIKKIEIEKILYEFYSFSGNVDAVISGDMVLQNKYYTPETRPFTDNDKGISYYRIEPVKVAETIITRDQFAFRGNFNEVNEYLSESTILKYGIAWETTHTPAKFEIRLTITATVTVEASIDF